MDSPPRDRSRPSQSAVTSPVQTSRGLLTLRGYGTELAEERLLGAPAIAGSGDVEVVVGVACLPTPGKALDRSDPLSMDSTEERLYAQLWHPEVPLQSWRV